MKATFAAALAFTTGACSLFTSLDGYSGGGAPGDGGSGPSDAAVDARDARDAAPDTIADAGDDASLPNLHPNGTFETTLDPWTGFQGSVALDPTAHSGAQSLRACTAASTTDYFTADDQGASGKPIVGATYHASGWVRTAPGAAAPSYAVLHLRTSDPGPPYLVIESNQTNTPTLDATWRYVETTLTVTKPAPWLNVYVGAPYVAGACFLLDDVRVERLP